MESRPLHTLPTREVFYALDSQAEGLTSAEAAARLSLFGPNQLRQNPPPPVWRVFLAQVTHSMALVLWISGLVALLAGELAVGIVIWVVVLVNAIFSFWQDYRAQRAMQALRHLLPRYARLIREGEEVQIPSQDVVPGDILVLAEGDSVPADARLIQEYGLRTNNAVLTGEAMASLKTSEPSLRDDLTELEQPNLIFAGATVVSGTGRAAVYATGMLTQFGRIANLTQEVEEPPSPLQQEMKRTTRRISAVAIALGAVVFMIALMEIQMLPFQAFVLGIGVIVATIPEGLTPTLTLTLAIAVQRLAQRGVLVKQLAVMERLGTISVLATDKSGTLTQNQMTIREAWVGGQSYTVTGIGYDPSGSFTPAADLEGPLGELLTAASLCNNSRLNPPTPERRTWTCLGDQTEAALRVMARKAGLDEASTADRLPRMHEIPFDAHRKRMTTIHRQAPGLVAYVKGAPREVLQRSDSIHLPEGVQPLDAARRTEILAATDGYARRSFRVLALARRTLPAQAGGFTAEDIEQHLTFLGLVAMMDPPRREVAGAIEGSKAAGVRWVMVTGDYGLTAESMARRIGMLTTEQPVILTGAELDAMSDREVQRLLRTQEIVFARMAPDHKLRLVAALQAMGEVVAVIGDGVNDAPALRKADVGISMGVSGTDVAKEAADLVITNDDFSSILVALEEGRAIYDNLRKFSTYIFVSNVPQIIPFVLTALTRIPLAMGVLQILAIDLGTDILPALALGMEKPEPDVMSRPARRRRRALLDRPLLARAFLWLGPIEASLCFAGFLLVYLVYGHGALVGLPPVPWLQRFALGPLSMPHTHLLASTVFFAGVITAQAGNVFACRTERGRVRSLGWLSNPYLLLGIAVELLMLVALIYLPIFAGVFGLTPLPWQAWPILLFYAPLLVLMEHMRKRVANWLDRLRRDGAETGGRAR
jgi:Ca2+-transporting ATPase